MSFAPTMGGGDITQLHPQGKGDDVGEDWFNEVAAWWLRHRFYPNEAARLAQEGDVVLRLVVGRDGRVESVEVDQKSGSPWLDLGALAVFRAAKLPPLPPDVRDPNVTVNFTIHYMIIR
jgi:TonB family protein